MKNTVTIKSDVLNTKKAAAVATAPLLIIQLS
jgi:hypothetical protein